MELFKTFNQKTWEMLKRAFMRSLILGLLLVTAALALDYLVDLARFHGSDWPERFPEILLIFRAAGILTWFELSIFWIRLATQPSVDTQAVARKACQDEMGAAVVYSISATKWLIRMIIMMQLCGFWK